MRILFLKLNLFIVLASFIAACDVEGEIRQGSINSTISANSGAAGGNDPVLGGMYYDSIEGLAISDSGLAGQTLILNQNLQPEWITAVPGGALPSAGGDMAGNLNLNNNYLSGDGDNEGLFIDSLGNVGIGTSMPTHELHVEGNAFKTVGGTVWATISDRRLKKNVKPISKGLSQINQLEIKEFEYKDNKVLGLMQRHDVGLVAQEVVEIFPEAVLYSGQYLMLDYHPIFITQLRAVQELSEHNQKLESRILKMEQQLKLLLENR